MKTIIIILAAVISFTSCGKKTSGDNSSDAETSDTAKISNDTAEIKITVDGEEVIIDAKKEAAPPIPNVKEDDMQTGVIFKKADTYIIRETMPDGAIVDYYAENLGAEFKKEGLKVKFKGTLLEIPSNVRMIGKPIKLTKIVKA